jgi:hypothetical protein
MAIRIASPRFYTSPNQKGIIPAMSEDHKSISEQSKKVQESQSPSDNVKIGETPEGLEQARQARIQSRMRRKKRRVIIK